jgi:hypothetical protein
VVDNLSRLTSNRAVENNRIMSPFPSSTFLFLVFLTLSAAPVCGDQVYSATTTSLLSTVTTDGGPIARLHAKHARMLVHENVWGIMATTSVAFSGAAYANVVSYSGEQ